MCSDNRKCFIVHIEIWQDARVFMTTRGAGVLLGKSGSLINTWKWPAAQQELFTEIAINSSALRGDLQTPHLPFLAAESSIWGKPLQVQRVQVVPAFAVGLIGPKYKWLDLKGCLFQITRDRGKIASEHPRILWVRRDLTDHPIPLLPC